jgi:hypothetical protein
MARSPWEPVTSRPSSHRTVTAGEVGFEHGGHFGVLLGKDLLAAHDESHLASERGEEVYELDAGDA